MQVRNLRPKLDHAGAPSGSDKIAERSSYPAKITAPDSVHIQKILYWSLFSLGLGWTTYLLLNSPGVPVQDEIGHYLLSRWAWMFPQYLLNLWGRPLQTLIYMLPALGGLTAARFASLLLGGLTVLFATKLAGNMGVRYLFLIPVFLWFQPWFHAYSFSVLPQIPFSLLLVLGAYFWSERRFPAASICLALLPLARHEGILITGLWFLFMLYRRDWKSLVITASPVILYNAIFYLVFGRLAAGIYLALRPTTIYGRGDWLHFVRPMPLYAGIPVLFFAVLALLPLGQAPRKAILLTGYAAYFLAHTLIYRFGLFASGGYQIFLLALAPALAILAALGLEYLLASSSHTRRFVPGSPFSRGLPIAGMLLAITLALLVGLRSRPRPLDREAVALRQAHEWIENSNLADVPIFSTHVWFYYFHNIPLTPGNHWASPPSLEAVPDNALVVWDARYSDQWGLDYATLSNESREWRKLAEFEDSTVILFQKVSGAGPDRQP